MTFSEHWESRLRANPQMRDPSTKMTITVSTLRGLLERAYEVGKAEASEDHGDWLGGLLPWLKS